MTWVWWFVLDSQTFKSWGSLINFRSTLVNKLVIIEKQLAEAFHFGRCITLDMVTTLTRDDCGCAIWQMWSTIFRALGICSYQSSGCSASQGIFWQSNMVCWTSLHLVRCLFIWTIDPRFPGRWSGWASLQAAESSKARLGENEERLGVLHQRIAALVAGRGWEAHCVRGKVGYKLMMLFYDASSHSDLIKPV